MTRIDLTVYSLSFKIILALFIIETANLFFNSIKIAPYIITENITENIVFIIKDWKP